MSTRMPNVYGGGANTNVNGLKFEQTTSLDSTLERKGFEIIDNEVYYQDRKIGWSVGKNKLYTKFLTPQNIDYKQYNSKRWQPDECFINELNQTAYIIEKNFRIRVVLWMKNYLDVILKKWSMKNYFHH